MTKTEMVLVEVVKAKDWDLIVDVGHFGHKILTISAKDRDHLYRRIYDMNDAYGPKGLIPAQGYDWSGLRDSSPEATKEMADFIRDYFLNVLNVTYYGVEKTSYV